MLKYTRIDEKFNLDLLWNSDLNLKTSTLYVHLQQLMLTSVVLHPCLKHLHTINIYYSHKKLPTMTIKIFKAVSRHFQLVSTQQH